MTFISLAFPIFFGVTAVVFYAIPQKRHNLWLLLASYFFIASWSISYAFFFAVLTTLNYFLGLGMFAQTQKRRQQAFLTIGVALNLFFMVSLRNISNTQLQGV